MNKTTTKRLTLHKETLRHTERTLDADQLRKVGGGDSWFYCPGVPKATHYGSGCGPTMQTYYCGTSIL